MVAEIDCRKARYFGIPWYSLGNYGKRKFENLVILFHSQEPITLIYH